MNNQMNKMAKISRNNVLVMLIVVIAIVAVAKAVPICDIDSESIDQCLPAVSGKNPEPPAKKCCKVIRSANLTCLCKYKSYLPDFGINIDEAMALPKKCGLKKIPSECRAS